MSRASRNARSELERERERVDELTRAIRDALEMTDNCELIPKEGMPCALCFNQAAGILRKAVGE